jgi:hypothetical protein
MYTPVYENSTGGGVSSYYAWDPEQNRYVLKFRPDAGSGGGIPFGLGSGGTAAVGPAAAGTGAAGAGAAGTSAWGTATKWAGPAFSAYKAARSGGGGKSLPKPGASTGTGLFGLFDDDPGASLWGGGNLTLLDLLNNPGRTDSTMFNRSLAASGRATNAAADAARGNAARSGFGNSGLAAALQAAIRGAGAKREGEMYGTEAMRREDLLRDDLGLLKTFVQDPNMAKYANDRGLQAQQSAQNAQKRAAQTAAYTQLIGALATADWGG